MATVPPALSPADILHLRTNSDSFHSACSESKSTPPTAPGTPRPYASDLSIFGLDHPSPVSDKVDLGQEIVPEVPPESLVDDPTYNSSPHAPFVAAEKPNMTRHFTASPPRFSIVLATIGCFVLNLIFACIREGFRLFFPDPLTKTEPGYARLRTGRSDFFTRRFYRRICDCWNRPINTRAGRVIGVMEREFNRDKTSIKLTGRTIPCINFASYNYLGFAEDLPSVTEDNLAALERYGTGACTSSQEGGQTAVLRELEQETAHFLGKEAAVVYAMGFVTNFSGLAPLFDKDTLVISDSLNHASLVLGVRSSTGRTKVFKHNDMASLEKTVRAAVVDGQPRTHKRWKRIVILVEGLYSMEGEILDLPRVVEIKKKYKCLLYVDEAHSIGALGATGRGVCEHHGVDPADVDLLMGTYTKSFGSIGGYIAGPRKLIGDLKRYSGGSLLGDTLHSAAVQQALSSLRVLQGKDGTTVGRDKIRQLKENSAYMRQELVKRDLVVLGEAASPVIPIMIYQPAKLSAFSRLLLARNVAVVVVGPPAADALEMRCRLCISAAHTRADLERAIESIDEAAEYLGIRYARPFPYRYGSFFA
jgi:serine palmitoyltransferase